MLWSNEKQCDITSIHIRLYIPYWFSIILLHFCQYKHKKILHLTWETLQKPCLLVYQLLNSLTSYWHILNWHFSGDTRIFWCIHINIIVLCFNCILSSIYIFTPITPSIIYNICSICLNMQYFFLFLAFLLCPSPRH